MQKFFTSFATKTAKIMGTSWAFLSAALVIAVWAVTGPLFHYSDTWQLVINTGTTIVTFLMVFLIQNTQNRDGKAMQLKLDELISAVKEAHNDMIDIESLTDEQLEEIAKKYKKVGLKDDDDKTKEVASRTAEQVAKETVEDVTEKEIQKVA